MNAENTGVGHSLASDLNVRQREAVLYLDGPCLVLAGAGSGKTRVITQKIAYLLRECAFPANRIVALTFTNKAAREMRERVLALVPGKQAKGLTISTFHALGLRFLRQEAAHFELKPDFSIMDATDSLAVIQELLATTDKARLRAVQQAISLWKNALLGPDQAAAQAQNPLEQEAASIYKYYEATLKAYQAVDFDDLIRLPARLLKNNDEVRQRWQNQVHYLLVDEYQDTNECQYSMVRSLTGSKSRFTVVGDDDQAIYAWRGATLENLGRLTTDYPHLKLIKLEQNYRSVQSVLRAANRVIANNTSLFEKELWSELGAGESIRVTAMDNHEIEAESIGRRISAERFERRAEWRDFAVLYRSNQQARVIEQVLRNLRIPYTLSGGQSFFDKAEIRDIMAYLRLLANSDDDPAFIRASTTPRRGVGQATLQALGTYASAHSLSLFAAAFAITTDDGLAQRQLDALQNFARLMQELGRRAKEESAADLLDQLLTRTRYESYLYDTLDNRAAQARWQNVRELCAWLARKSGEDGLSITELAQHVALVTMLERNDEENPDAVKLSTLHAAKGLEFPHVFLIGVEEGLLPHKGREEPGATEVKEDPARIQEERRLMYVGITRAQRSLHISWCKRRRRARQDVICEPSRFIAEMGFDVKKLRDNPADEHLSPSERLAMLKDLLKQ